MLLNFKKRFAPKILDGTKRHTIRAKRKTRPRVGETCHLYTGLRQKGAQLLGRFACVKVEEIQIFANGIFIDGIGLDTAECEALARRDGFESFAEMMAFWDGRLPFDGDIIHWKWTPLA